MQMRSLYEIEGEKRGMQKIALRQLRKKFGELPERVQARISAMDSETELEALLDAILDARSLADLGLADGAGGA
jgi:uncharacterized protein DUF4351